MLKLHLTCSACPEQYDVYDDTGKQVGYLRLRHGFFTADVPDHCGRQVFEAEPYGDGSFMDYERDDWLKAACRAILESMGSDADPVYEIIHEAPEAP